MLRFLSLFSCIFLSSFLLVQAETNPDPNDKSLGALFHGDALWQGGDGCYSIPLQQNKVAWLFGDSFIGTTASGSRKDKSMVRNAVAIQDLKNKSMKFYWARTADGKADSFFPAGKDYILWPGDGVNSNNKLYCFVKRIATKPGQEEDPFGFIWKQDELMIVDNPDEDPETWQSRHMLLPFSNKDFHIGTACLNDAETVYVLGLRESTKEAFLTRIPAQDLSQLNLSAWEFLSLAKGGKASWVKKANKATPLWKNAAAEASISHIPGGYLCIYHRGGMGAEIVARTAKKMEGPWSAEKVLFVVPEADSKRGMVYAAKAHPEQDTKPGEVIVTYAVNPGTLDAHAKDPEAYFPHVISVKLPSVE